MPVAPTLPKLAPKDMQWVRWVNARLSDLDSKHSVLRSNVTSAVNQSNSVQAAAASVIQAQATALTINVPTAPPQAPSTPLLSSDHGTVTITWDGTVYAPAPNGQGNIVAPAIGFNRVDVYRSSNSTDGYALINYITNGATSIVDASVTVGNTYYYRFVTVDNIKVASAPGPTNSIVVKGIDLGNLETDVKNAISAAAAAGQAGQNAAAAAATAAQTADAKAGSALNSAATAQQRADAAYSAAQAAAGVREVYIGTVQPTDTSGNVLWIDTTNSANTPKRYNGTMWVAVTDQAVVNAANAAANAKSAADAAQATANNALNVANSAATAAGNAQNTANGKNKVNYSINAPTGGGAYGDVWFQYRDNILIGQWFYDGSYWQPKQIDSQVIGNLDAGKITSGIISADRIGANSISAQKMIAGTITADSGILSDAVITTAKIADLAVSSAKIASLDAAKIQAGTITSDKLSAGAITADKIAAGSIDTNRLAAGAVTAAKINSTAIDGMTITGSVFRTSGNAGTNGVIMDSSGIRAYQNNNQTLLIDANGNVSLTGYVNATGGNFTGYLNAQSGYISGNLLVSGAIATAYSGPRLVLDQRNLRIYNPDTDTVLNVGSVGTPTINNLPAGTGRSTIFWSRTSDIDSSFAYMHSVGQQQTLSIGAMGGLFLSGPGTNSSGNASFCDFNMVNDGSGQIYSKAIRNRNYTSNNRTDTAGTHLMCITDYGTLGQLTGVLSSNYTSSSSRRFKHDIEDWRPDIRKVLELNPVQFKYNDGDGTTRVGMIAEQMAELGLEELVFRDPDGTIQTIEYMYFGAALLHVAREQQKTIDKLEQRLQEAGI